MTWFLLAIAIAAEIVGTLLLKLSDGFTKLWPSVGVLLGYATAFALLSTFRLLMHYRAADSASTATNSTSTSKARVWQ